MSTVNDPDFMEKLDRDFPKFTPEGPHVSENLAETMRALLGDDRITPDSAFALVVTVAGSVHILARELADAQRRIQALEAK